MCEQQAFIYGSTQVLLLLTLGSFAEVQNADVAELQAGTMTQETDVTGLVEHTGMVLVVDGVGVVVAAIGSYIVALASFLDVAINDNLAINGNSDVVALNTDLLLAPLAQRLVLDTLGRDNTIYRAVNLIFAQAGIHGCVVIQNLALAHTIVSGIYTHRSTDTYTIVNTWAQEAELEAEDEVAILLGGVQVALVAIVGCYVDATVDGHITNFVTNEVIQVGTVEQQLKALSLLLIGKDIDG